MVYTPEVFNKFCHDAAQKFLQTVVVIDDEAVFHTNKEEIIEKQEIKVIVPPKGTLHNGTTKSEDGIEAKEKVAGQKQGDGDNGLGDESPNILYAKSLIDSFADDGILCSVMKPDPDEERLVERAVSVASAADILVVDWMLGRDEEGEGDAELRAKEIIKCVVEKDLERRGRLRLIAVYTAEDNPVEILDQLYEHIKDLKFPDGAIIKDVLKFTIHNRFLKIVVLLKPNATGQIPGIIPINSKDLPRELQELFADLNHGLLPSVALRAIAAVREDTHHLLAVLNGGLDSALVGHRCLLPHPNDAEEFCEDIVADEIRSILAIEKIGKKYADDIANKKWIGSKIGKEKPHEYKQLLITRDQAFSLVEEGQAVHDIVLGELRVGWLERKLKDEPGFKDIKKKKIYKNKAAERIREEGQVAAKLFNVPDFNENIIPQILSGNEKLGLQTNLDFSRLCSLKREATGLRKPVEDWIPRLNLGTILQLREGQKDTFLLCLQPRCDCVRLKKDKVWNFPFLILKKASSKLNVVIKGFDAAGKPVDKKLCFDPKPREQIVYQFECVTGDAIEASVDGDLYSFKDVNNRRFIWVADMKDFIAQKIADDLSTRVGSVGIDEFDWLRRKSR